MTVFILNSSLNPFLIVMTNTHILMAQAEDVRFLDARSMDPWRRRGVFQRTGW